MSDQEAPGRTKDGMFEHFSRISDVYRHMRTTDEAPVLYIRDALAGRETVRAADIGCGDGRYDRLLLRHVLGLHLTCVDVNPGMLSALSALLSEDGHVDFSTRASSLEELELEQGSLDAVFSFNAVHHFDFPAFLEKAGRALAAGGQVFVYTRTPEQNASTIWGRFFPGFLEQERRLFSLGEMKRWIAEDGHVDLVEVKNFRYPRAATLGRLLKQARSRHYSTFSLYDAGAFDEACRTFAARIRRQFADPARVRWNDENTLLRLATATSGSP